MKPKAGTLSSGTDYLLYNLGGLVPRAAQALVPRVVADQNRLLNIPLTNQKNVLEWVPTLRGSAERIDGQRD